MPKRDNTNETKDQSQWVILMKDSCLKKDEDKPNKPVFCKLRHPRYNKGALFLFCHGDKEVLEVTQFKEEFRSWFLGKTIQEDGSLYMTVPVNPVFLMLHYLIKEGKDGKFKPLDQMVKDEEFPECQRLCSCECHHMLANFTDVKGPDDFKVYKYSEEKSLTWLKLKAEEIATEQAKRFNVGGGAQAATFKSNSKDEAKTEDFVRYAHGMLSEYLPLSLSLELKAHMGIKDPVVLHEKPKIDEPNAKRLKKDVTPTDDYSSKTTEKEGAKNAAKQTRAQKALSKVDKKGMKSIFSFFSPKGK